MPKQSSSHCEMGFFVPKASIFAERNPMSERKSIIDMGTNTFHLLVAENECNPFHVVHSSKLDVRFGKGGISNGYITQEARSRAEQALKKFAKKATQYGVTPQAYGTSALRCASNQKEVIQQLTTRTGIPIEVLNGDEEAEYISLGVRAAFPNNHASMLIMDIGGGSVEFIIVKNNLVQWKQSFELGIQRIIDLVRPTDPVSSSDFQQLNKLFEDNLTALEEALGKHQPERFVGCAGTFDTLSNIYEQREGLPSSVSDAAGHFTMTYFPPLYKELTTSTYQQRLNEFHLAPLRAEMIVPALSMVEWVLRQHRFTSFEISRYSMKEGILHKLLNCH